MAVNFDSSVEREFLGTGPTSIGLFPTHAAASNNDYMFICATASDSLSGADRRVASVKVSEEGVGGGGNLVELQRITIARGAADISADAMQLWAIRNKDLPSPLDLLKIGIQVRCEVAMTHTQTHDTHWAMFLIYTPSFNVATPLLDTIQGGICQIADENTGDADANWNIDPADAMISHRAHGPPTALGVHTPTNYNVFDTTFATHTRVSASQTSVIAIGRGGGIAPGMGLNKSNTGDDTFLNFGGMRFSEKKLEIFTGPLLTTSENTQDCSSGDLIPPPPAPKFRRARGIQA